MPFVPEDILPLLRGIAPSGFCDVFRLGLITGARSIEIAALRPEHLTLEEDGYWLQVPGTKTKAAKRRVPVPRAFDPLMERMTEEAAEYLVPLYPGKQWPTERHRSRYITKEANLRRRRLKLPHSAKQGVHSTRRTYTEMLEGAGVPVETTALLVGHKRQGMTYGTYSKGAWWT